MLTIAHRLKTVINSDRMLVMSSGTVAEFAEPKMLLADENSLLCAMVKPRTRDKTESEKKVLSETSIVVYYCIDTQLSHLKMSVKISTPRYG